jgi:hypothetical protein
MQVLTKEGLEEVLEHEKYAESREQYVKRMSDAGFEIYYPEPDELLLDFDTEEAVLTFKDRLKKLRAELKLQLPARIWPSKSGYPRCHASVRVTWVLTIRQRIAFQTVLGSDPVRELLSLVRDWHDDPYPSLLADLPEYIAQAKEI